MTLQAIRRTELIRCLVLHAARLFHSQTGRLAEEVVPSKDFSSAHPNKSGSTSFLP
jgi:hypothetical protein